MKTIASISTPVGVGAISIVRMSGDNSLKVATKLFSCKEKVEPRKLYLGTFSYNEIKERCLMVYFKGPNSYTGEDMVEFQCHGGETLTNAVLKALLENGASLAENGEFTKRAFLNGKISLDGAEGVIDMINASSEAELKAGYNLLSGGLKEKIEEIQNKITDGISAIDMTLDYPEHDDEIKTLKKTDILLDEILEELNKLYSTEKYGKLVKSGINVAIVGKPNVGKSSLLNSLIGTNRAIVTEVAGTTRDTVTETIVVKGIKFNFIDTAGVRESNDIVEKIGIERSLEEIERADIILVVLDGSKELEEEDKKLLDLTKNRLRLILINKTDKELKLDLDGIKISALKGENINKVKDEIFNIFECNKLSSSGVVLTNERHTEAIRNAIDFCNQAKDACLNQTVDIVSFLLKEIWNELGKITGVTETESIIDNIFSKFCLGK